MKSNASLLKNQKGQVAVEYILLFVIMTAVAMTAHKMVAESNMLQDYVRKPWEHVASLIETGVWEDAQQARAKHPGKLARHLSLKGEPK